VTTRGRRPDDAVDPDGIGTDFDGSHGNGPQPGLTVPPRPPIAHEPPGPTQPAGLAGFTESAGERFHRQLSDEREAVIIPEPLSYRMKRRLLGPPLVTERLSIERLGKVMALGVIAPDMISSTNYGTEEMLAILVPVMGVAAFTMIIPVTLAILGVLFFVTLSYREVVTTYTKAGGSYVVSRDNFGTNVAQVAAAALIIDYVLTVAVQVAAGTDAVTSTFPQLTPYTVPICIAVVVLMAYANLRGLREAGKIFAVPTYFFVTMTGLMVITGLIRALLGKLSAHPIVHVSGSVPIGHPGAGFLMGASAFILLRAFANGGSSLTGLEAVSNSVSAFRPPEGINARRVLVMMCTILGVLVLGVSVIAHFTHAVPYTLGSPTVISQEAHYVFGTGPGGTVLFYLLQASAMLILWTGGNTSFNGFPYLVSFVASDAYLPRWLTKRGHRLNFSNGIIVLGLAGVVLLVVTGARLDALVSLYAIGVFTGFTMAGAGMVRHHQRERGSHWRRGCLVNGISACLSAVVVVIFAVTKFTEGAWAVVVLFPLIVWALIRLHRQYTDEAQELEANAPMACEAPILRRHVVLVFVGRLDLATARALQYARSFMPDELRAVHIILDTAAANELETQWSRLGLSRLPLDLVECPDRRLARSATEIVAEAAADGQTEVTVLLPRRFFAGFWDFILHDRTARQIASVVGLVENVTPTIVPFRMGKRQRQVAQVHHGLDQVAVPATPATGERSERHRRAGREAGLATAAERMARLQAMFPGQQPTGTVPVASIRPRQRARVTGRVRSVRVQPRSGVPSLECTLADSSSQMTLVFQGRRRVPGIEPGALLVVEGMVGQRGREEVMVNPLYWILSTREDGEKPPGHGHGP
jgi:amino acid transporter